MPGGVLVEVAKVTVEVPLEVMEAGEIVAVTPVGSVEVERSTVPEKPLTADTVAMVEVEVPTMTDFAVAFRVMPKDGTGMTRLNVAVLVRLPNVPRTVME